MCQVVHISWCDNQVAWLFRDHWGQLPTSRRELQPKAIGLPGRESVQGPPFLQGPVGSHPRDSPWPGPVGQHDGMAHWVLYYGGEFYFKGWLLSRDRCEQNWVFESWRLGQWKRECVLLSIPVVSERWTCAHSKFSVLWGSVYFYTYRLLERVSLGLWMLVNISPREED